MTPRIRSARPTARALALCLFVACVSAADDAPLGSYELHGARDDGRRFQGELVLRRRESGGLRVDRSYEDLELPVSRRRKVLWRSLEVRQRGAELEVVYTLPAFQRVVGAAERLRGVDGLGPRRRNRIEARYRIDPEGRIREVLTNTTRFAPEAEWKHATAQGAREGALRLRLGYATPIPLRGSLDLIVPCAGTLRLEGAAQLYDEAGKALRSAPREPGQPDATTHYLVEPGSYHVRGAVGTTVRALLLQAAQLAGRDAAPWEAPGYYPLNELDRDGELNPETLYVADGPLERFDRAFALRAPQSAVAWERGEAPPGQRISFQFQQGHYLRTPVIRERHAETDLRADLDGDGRIGGTAAEILAGLDRDGDGQVRPSEVDATAWIRLEAALYEYYDFDRDGKIEVGLEVALQDGRRFDRDRDGVLSRTELRAAMQGPGGVARSARGFHSQWRSAILGGARSEGVLRAEELTPGGWDFVDDRDLDGDGARDFDWNPLVLLKAGGVKVANSLGIEGPWLLLRTKGQVERVRREEVGAIRRGADGDYDDEYQAEWWGHCNGAALAGILFEEPREARTFRGVRFEPEHLKGLLCEFATGSADLSGFNWSDARGNSLSPEAYAAGFHQTLRQLGAGSVGFMIDAELKPMGGAGQVWNYALTGYALELVEAPGGDPQVLEVRGSLSHLGGQSALRYRVEFDGAGEPRKANSRTTWLVQKGRWGSASNGDVVDPERLLYYRYLSAPDRITDHRRTANPHLTEARLSELFGGRLPYRVAAR